MTIRKLSPGDMSFAQAKGYSVDDLTQICQFDAILYDELHMGPEYEEAPQYFLTYMLETNPRYAQSYIQVALGYEKLADKGNLLAKSRLAGMYRYSHEVYLQDKALEYAREGAAAGLYQAQYLCALITDDDAEAARNMRAAWGEGYPFATGELGCWYYKGAHGIPCDPLIAETLCMKGGVSKSVFEYLFASYQKNKISSMKFKRGLQDCANSEYAYYLCAATLGTVYAQEKNYAEAYRWLKKSADVGVFTSCESLSEMYESGFRGPESSGYWRRKAEEYKEIQSMYSIYRSSGVKPVHSSTGTSSSVTAAPGNSSKWDRWYYVILVLVLAATVYFLFFR